MRAQNPIGVHFNVLGPLWEGDARQQIADSAAEIGYDFIEVTALTPADFDAAGTKAALQSAGISANLCTAMALDNDISNADCSVARKGEEHLNRALDLAAEINAEWLVGVTYGAWARYSAPPSAAGFENCVEILRRISTRASEMGISVGMEVLNRFENNLLNTTSQAKTLIDHVNTGNLFVQLDTYHAHLEETSQAQAVHGCDGALGYLHVGESHRGRLGTGSIDFDSAFREVMVADFAGPITFEAFSAQGVTDEAKGALCVWRNQWDDSHDVAAHAIGFINEKLDASRRAVHSSQWDDNRSTRSQPIRLPE